jgi:hypothetical protein
MRPWREPKMQTMRITKRLELVLALSSALLGHSLSFLAVYKRNKSHSPKINLLTLKLSFQCCLESIEFTYDICLKEICAIFIIRKT